MESTQASNSSFGSDKSSGGGVNSAVANWQMAQCAAGSPDAGALRGAVASPAISGQQASMAHDCAAHCSAGSATAPRRWPGTTTLNHAACNSSTMSRRPRDRMKFNTRNTRPPERRSPNCSDEDSSMISGDTLARHLNTFSARLPFLLAVALRGATYQLGNSPRMITTELSRIFSVAPRRAGTANQKEED